MVHSEYSNVPLVKKNDCYKNIVLDSENEVGKLERIA